MRRKIPIIAALCLATFTGFCGGLCGQLVPGPQSKLYGVTTTQMAYQVITHTRPLRYLLLSWIDFNIQCWNGHWRLCMVSAVPQNRTKLSCFLVTLRPHVLSNLEWIDDQQGRLLQFPWITFGLRTLWDGYRCLRTSRPGRPVLFTSKRQGFHDLSLYFGLWYSCRPNFGGFRGLCWVLEVLILVVDYTCCFRTRCLLLFPSRDRLAPSAWSRSFASSSRRTPSKSNCDFLAWN